MDLTQAARPLYLPGNPDRAILLIHGFTSTPGSLAGWADGLRRADGATVEVPLLPGHGTRWEDLNKVSWRDWERTVLASFDSLTATHQQVAVAGLSLGGALAALVAARRPSAQALILVNHLMWLGNPALVLAPLIRRLTPSMAAVAGDIKKAGVIEPAYDRVPTGGVEQFRRLLGEIRPRLGTIRVPTLILKSREDHVIPGFSATRTLEKLGSPLKELVWLDDSYHVATMDHDLPRIVSLSADFLRKTGRS